MADIFDRISPDQQAMTGFDPSKYDTKLSPQDEIQFQGWKSKYAPKDSGADYDLRGAYKAGIKPDPQRGHFPDTFKKPNHPTFSTESQYSGKDGFIGGKWGDGDSYTPSATNLQFKQPHELQQYFQQNEPKSKLNLPQQKQDIFDKISPDKPKWTPPTDPGLFGESFSAQNPMRPQDQDTLLNALPIAGGTFGGIPGAAAGSFAKQALSSDPSIGGGVADTFLNGVIPAGIEAGLSGGIKNGVSRLLSKLPEGILQKIPGYAKADISQKLASRMGSEATLVQNAARAARANRVNLATPTQVPAGNGILDASGNPAMKTVLQDHPVYSTPLGKKLAGVESSAPAFSKVAPAADELLSDIQSVRNAKLMSGADNVSKIAANDLVTSNFKASSNSFNAAGMLDKMAGPKADVYKEALGKGYDSFKQLLELGVQKGVGKETPNLFSWQEGRKLAITGSALQVLGIPFKATEAVVLGADAMRKIAQDPKLGALILQAARTGSKSPESSVLMKTAMLGLRGTTLYLTGPDGQKDEVQVGQDQQGNPQLQTAAPKR